MIMVAVFLVGGCSGMSTTQQRTLSGGAIGAGSGALIGWAAGCPACGAAIGGGAACWEGMPTTSTRNPKAGIEGICPRLRLTSW